MAKKRMGIYNRGVSGMKRKNTTTAKPIKNLDEHGFKSYQGNSPVNTGSSTVTLMKSPSGFSISVSEHKK